MMLRHEALLRGQNMIHDKFIVSFKDLTRCDRWRRFNINTQLLLGNPLFNSLFPQNSAVIPHNEPSEATLGQPG